MSALNGQSCILFAWHSAFFFPCLLLFSTFIHIPTWRICLRSAAAFGFSLNKTFDVACTAQLLGYDRLKRRSFAGCSSPKTMEQIMPLSKVGYVHAKKSERNRGNPLMTGVLYSLGRTAKYQHMWMSWEIIGNWWRYLASFSSGCRPARIKIDASYLYRCLLIFTIKENNYRLMRTGGHTTLHMGMIRIDGLKIPTPKIRNQRKDLFKKTAFIWLGYHRTEFWKSAYPSW